MNVSLLILTVLTAQLISDQEAARCRAAASVAYAALNSPTPAPTPEPPKPTPAPSDACTNCNGTGILGDGTIKIKCPVCDGTGKVKSAPAQPARTYQAPVQTWQRKRIFPR